MTQENLDEQRALVEKHIQIEAELIKKLEKMMPTIENKKVKFLLNVIFADERRHHGILKILLEVIVKGETITEDDWWELLWEIVHSMALQRIALLAYPNLKTFFQFGGIREKKGKFYLPISFAEKIC